MPQLTHVPHSGYPAQHSSGIPCWRRNATSHKAAFLQRAHRQSLRQAIVGPICKHYRSLGPPHGMRHCSRRLGAIRTIAMFNCISPASHETPRCCKPYLHATISLFSTSPARSSRLSTPADPSTPSAGTSDLLPRRPLLGDHSPRWLLSILQQSSRSGHTTKKPTGRASATMFLSNTSMTTTSSALATARAAKEAAQTTRSTSLTSLAPPNKATRLLAPRLYLPGRRRACTPRCSRRNSQRRRRASTSGRRRSERWNTMLPSRSGSNTSCERPSLILTS